MCIGYRAHVGRRPLLSDPRPCLVRQGVAPGGDPLGRLELLGRCVCGIPEWGGEPQRADQVGSTDRGREVTDDATGVGEVLSLIHI